MLAVYDLAVSPPTYDFVGFLASAERHRIRSGQAVLTVAIVSGPNGGFRQDDLPPHDPVIRRKMLDNIVKPMVRLLPSCKEIVEIGRDEVKERLKTETHIFPVGYDPEAPKSHYGTNFMLKAVRAGITPFVLSGVEPVKDLITITLRQSHYWPTRNSNVAEWVKAAHALRAKGKRVVFVPDTDGYGSELDSFEIDVLASTDLLHRARLCAGAELNLSVSNGPAGMFWMMPQVAMMVFKMEAPDAPCADARFFASQGLPVGSQIGRPGHKIVWADDNADRILQEIEEGFGPLLKKFA
jgi:hypothetical protein